MYNDFDLRFIALDNLSDWTQRSRKKDSVSCVSFTCGAFETCSKRYCGDRTKWYWTTWHGQNGTDKMTRTKWQQLL